MLWQPPQVVEVLVNHARRMTIVVVKQAANVENVGQVDVRGPMHHHSTAWRFGDGMHHACGARSPNMWCPCPLLSCQLALELQI